MCKGAHHVSEEFHEEFKDEEDFVWAWTKEWYGFTEAGMKWLENRGFKWEKICAGPGDLLIWDSRLPHYNLSPTKETPRFCLYTCYMPAKDATKEDLEKKKAAFYGKDTFRQITSQRAKLNQTSVEHHTGQTLCRLFSFRCSAMGSPILTTSRNLVLDHRS